MAQELEDDRHSVTPRLRILIVSNLFPNAAQPGAAPFSRQQFGELGRLCDAEVLGLLPWFPAASLFARWSVAGQLVDVPPTETIAGLTVHHPRMLYLPRLGGTLNPLLAAASLLRCLLRHRGRVDVVLASWAYPEGVASVWLCRLLKIPVVMQVLGSDLNVIARARGPRRVLTLTLPLATRVVAVSRPLAETAIALGAPPSRVVVVPNGVDTTLFRPGDRAVARAALGLPPASKIVLFVGALVRTKGVLDLLDAFAVLAAEDPAVVLVLVGKGAEDERCREMAARLGGRIFVPGARPHAEIARYMAAADVFTLPSWHEGTPNVVLEALASGRRVVATRVGGIPDIVTAAVQGELVSARDVPELTAALRRGLATSYDANDIAATVTVDWSRSAELLLDVLTDAARE